MKPLASLRSRVFVASAAVAVLPVAAALALATRQIGRQAEAEVARGAEEAGRLVGGYQRSRRLLLAERAELVADLPRLKAAMAEADARTLEPVARDYRERVSADVFVVVDRNGRTLTALGTATPRWDGPLDVVRFRADAGRLLETIATRVEAGSDPPETLGTLTLAFALDQEFVSRLRSLTGSDVAVVSGGVVYASTLPRRFDASLLAPGPRRGVGWLRLGDERYAALRLPLGRDAQGPEAVVLRSRPDVLRPLRTLQEALAIAALVSIAVGVLLSWAVAGTVTRPLAALTDAMKDIARTGDLARGMPPSQRWDDEDAKLLARTFGALTSSIARFQREAATRERLSALGRLSTVIAHEVRNPLMIIKGSLRVLRAGDAPAADVREAASDIGREVERLNRIVADVLDFARPLRLEPAAVEITALLRDAASAALEAGETVPARFAFDGEHTIVTDGERLRAVVVNLVANARDSVLAREDGAARPIEIGVRPLAEGRLLVRIEDQGIGIAEPDLPRVFEPYFTTKRTGTGLGLAIARKLVEALGGTIRLESCAGLGTRIEIELPPALDAAAMEGR